MSENILEFLKHVDGSEGLLLGPFTYNAVVVDGRRIPNLTGFKDGDHHTTLVVDGRFCATFSDSDARQAAWLIANAMAVSQGYSHLGAETKGNPFAAQIAQIGAPQ